MMVVIVVIVKEILSKSQEHGARFEKYPITRPVTLFERPLCLILKALNASAPIQKHGQVEYCLLGCKRRIDRVAITFTQPLSRRREACDASFPQNAKDASQNRSLSPQA